MGVSMRIKAWAGLALGLALLGWPGVADAKLQRELSYPFSQIWSSATRLVRVDLRLKVHDKDAEAGFMLFDYVERGRNFPGSFQLIRSQRDGLEVVTGEFHVEGMPRYVERYLLDKLSKKLRADYGDPKPRPDPAPPAESPDPPEQDPEAEQGPDKKS